MPTFNRGYIIKNAIQSVLDETFLNWELIIIDDVSDDNTEEIVKSFIDPRIIFVKNKENKGANYSRNLGCTIAKGDILAFLDSDNIWKNEKLEKQIRELKIANEDVAFVFCKTERIDQANKVSIIPDFEPNMQELENILRRNNIIDMSTVLMKREIFNKVGAFDEEMPRLQDWDILFRIIVVFQYKAVYIPEVLAYNRIQENSISTDIYKYQKAIVCFLKKYNTYLEPEDIQRFFSILIKNTKNKMTLEKYVDELVDCVDLDFTDLYRILAQQFYQSVQYNQILFLWKKNMEKSKERTIFISDYDWNKMTIALYGLGRWGELIYSEMKNCGFQVKYGIDKKVKKFHDLKIVKMQEIPQCIDMIIVSVIYEYKEIYRELTKYYSGKIISIEELVSDFRFK